MAIKNHNFRFNEEKEDGKKSMANSSLRRSEGGLPLSE